MAFFTKKECEWKRWAKMCKNGNLKSYTLYILNVVSLQWAGITGFPNLI